MTVACLYVGFPNADPPGPGSVMVTLFETDGAGNPVSAASTPLDPRLDIDPHSPDGFNWGYSGSGAAQLSLALVAHATEDAEKAQVLHQRFKRLVIARLPYDEQWAMSANVVRALAKACLDQW